MLSYLFVTSHLKMLIPSSLMFTCAHSAMICHLYPAKLVSKCHSKPVLLKEAIKIYGFSSMLAPKGRMKKNQVELFYRRHFNPAEAERNVPSAVKIRGHVKLNVF